MTFIVLEVIDERGKIRMDISERKREIIDLLTAESNISTNKLSRLLGVSQATIRNDLNDLANKGILIRRHGGAFHSFHASVLQRQKLRTKEKNLIGKEAASLVHDGDTIMIEAGTTIAAFSKHLLGKRDIKVVTHSTLVLPYARINPNIHLTIVGGYYNPQSETFLGPIAIAQLDQFFVKMAFIGCDGFSIEEGLSGHSAEAAEVTKKMAERSENTILLADSSKYNKKGFAFFLPFSKIDMLITDKDIGMDIVQQLEAQGCKVVTV